jgi:hypothetical protein
MLCPECGNPVDEYIAILNKFHEEPRDMNAKAMTPALFMDAKDHPISFDLTRINFIYPHQQVQVLMALVEGLRNEIEFLNKQLLDGR